MAQVITIAAIVVALMLVWWIWKIVAKRLPDQLTDIVDQLFPVVAVAIVVVAVLVAIDPDQAETLKDGVIKSIPNILVAIIIVILARALGRILGVFVEAGLGRVSPAMAARGRIAVSSLVLAVGIIIALQQVGISTDIILILVAAVSFGIALTLALAFGLGAVPVARQVAAGRHVKERHAEARWCEWGRSKGGWPRSVLPPPASSPWTAASLRSLMPSSWQATWRYWGSSP
jgi:hypothetical protein